MYRRSLLFGGAAMAGFGIVNGATGRELEGVPDLPRDQDPFAQQSGDPVFVSGDMAKNAIGRYFGLIPDLDQPFQARFETADGPRTFSDLTGKVRLLALWAEWCPPCLQELVEMDALQAAHGDDRFEILAVLSGSPSRMSFATARKTIDDAGASRLALWLEPDGGYQCLRLAVPSHPMPGREGRPNLPCVVLVDAKGTVRGHMMGMKSAPKVVMSQVPTPHKPGDKDVVLDTVTESHVLQPGERVGPSIWSLPDASVFIEALKTGALDG